MNLEELQYLGLVRKILDEGVERPDRTGVGTKAIFGTQMRFDLAEGFPLFTTKKMPFKNTVRELLWFISGSTNAYDLPKATQPWWTPWADKDGSLGPTYGYLLRKLEVDGQHIDQLTNVIESIKSNPYSRRHNISLWSPKHVPETNLPPCHGNLIQFFISDGKLSCAMVQRSGDFMIGVPVNVASYSLLTHMIAQQCDLEVGEYIHTIHDTHIYLNHIEGAYEMIKRVPNDFPQIKINTRSSIDDYREEDFELLNYNHYSKIVFPVAV